MRIHTTGKLIDGVQRCTLCNKILFEQDKVNIKLFKIPTRLAGIKNSITGKPVISSEGWIEGINLLETPNKLEHSKKKANCKDGNSIS